MCPSCSCLAGRPRAAALALRRQQAGGRGGRRPVAPDLAAVRAPAVYGPGDRETLAYFKMAARGFALQPNRPDARLSLIHVEDLAEALALASIGPHRLGLRNRRRPARRLQPWRHGGGRGGGARPTVRSCQSRRGSWTRRAANHSPPVSPDLNPPAKSGNCSTPTGRCMTGAWPRHGFARVTISPKAFATPSGGIAARMALVVKHGVTNCYFTRNRCFCHMTLS